MKNLIYNVFFIFVIIFLKSEQVYSANELFISNGTGNWNATSTWQMSTNGGAN